MHKSSERRIYLYVAAYIVMLMLLCVDSSPLIRSPEVDSPVFIAMGQAMLRGKIMFKDLFDHKGLYTFVLNCIGAMISGWSLLGLFIVECVFMAACACIVYALFSKYTGRLQAFMGMQIFMMLALKRFPLEGGNFTEEYALLFQVWAIYLLDRDCGRHSPLLMFFQGILSGAALFLRTNLAMMWAGIALVAGIDMLIHKKLKLLAKNIAAGLAGAAVASLPVVLYAVINDAVSDTIFGTFLYNFIYIKDNRSSLSFIHRSVIILSLMGKTLMMSTVLSIIIMLVKYRKSYITPYYWTMLAFSAVGVCASGRYIGHYYEYLVPFYMPFAYEGALLLSRVKYKYAVVAALCAVSIFFGLRALPESVRLQQGRFVLHEEVYRMHNAPYYSENEKVLVTGSDPRLYNILRVTPHLKYFYIPSTLYKIFPEPFDAQAESIISGENDVVFVRGIDDINAIYPESGRSSEIADTLNTLYTLLYYDEANNIRMYGRKR